MDHFPNQNETKPKKSPAQDDWKFLVGGARLDNLYAAVSGGARQLFAQGMSPWALAYGLSRLLTRFNRTLLLITPSRKQAWEVQQSLSFFLGLSEHWTGDPLECPLWPFPSAQHRMPAEPFVAPDVQAQRLAALYLAAASDNAKIIVASAKAYMHALNKLTAAQEGRSDQRRPGRGS